MNNVKVDVDMWAVFWVVCYVLFWNFGENTFDLYDAIIHFLMK